MPNCSHDLLKNIDIFILFYLVSMLPWLRPPNFMPPLPGVGPPPTSQNEDSMAKFLRQNIHHSLLAAAGAGGGGGGTNQKSEQLPGTPNFACVNKDVTHPPQPPPSLTRSSTPNTNEPCSPPPTLMPPPYQLGSDSQRKFSSPAANLLSSGRIPKADPMEGQLQDMLHFNMERCAGKQKIVVFQFCFFFSCILFYFL